MDESRITLKELQELIKGTIQTELKSFYWVSAEISECTTNYSGHCYLELIEKDGRGDSISARIRAVIWGRKARFLLPFFKTTAGIDLSEGLSVLVRGKLEYHPAYGLSLNIIDIDPKYTIGDLAQKRSEILNRLRSEGILEMNKELVLPPHPAKVAVISSKEAAGYQDFKDHLLANQSGYNYELKLFTAVMQGQETEKSILEAMGRVSDSINDFDVLVIVRGGGSQADLSWFDNYDIAYFITQFPIPVIIGIGHDKDISVADIVAHTSCKTPTAVADFIIGQSTETERLLITLGREITTSAMTRLDRSRTNVSTLRNKLISSSRLRLTGQKINLKHKGELISTSASRLIQSKYTKLSVLAERIRTEPARFVSDIENKIQNISRSIEHLSPKKVLERGYSITLYNGQSLKDSREINKGDSVTTLLKNGRIESEVFDIKE